MPLIAKPHNYKLMRGQRNFGALYTAIILFSFHWAIVLFINSSFLEQFFNGHTIGTLYGAGACMSIFGFVMSPILLRHVGNYTATLFFTTLEIISLLGMAMSNSPHMALISFCVHAMATPLILYHIDIFMEEMDGSNEKSTGSKRGLILGIMSLTMALAALFSGYLISDETYTQFHNAYIASALFLIPFLFILFRFFRTFSDPAYPSINLRYGITSFWSNTNLRGVFGARFFLELFFTWMVIYTPLYLSTVIGFDWDTIGTILFVGLLAYLLLEYAVGIIADTYIGEKEMMITGFIIMGIATALCAILTPNPLYWMAAMFMTRVGASLVETTSESYFFKHTNGKDANLVSFFRISRPLSHIVGTTLGSTVLLVLPMQSLFIILGILMIPGMLCVIPIVDTK